MVSLRRPVGPLGAVHGRAGLTLLLAGEALIVLRDRPFSDYYFPFVWVGFTLLLDAAVYSRSGRSLFVSKRPTFLTLYILSIGFWWLFELLNVGVHNWVYVGAGSYTGAAYVLFASIDFSTVLAAVWVAAQLVFDLLPPVRVKAERVPLSGLLRWAMVLVGVLALVLPVFWPSYAFGLIWLALFFLLDPINDYLGRPSIAGSLRSGNWQLPLAFALGALLCGFCWEAWNFWSMPKWEYRIPHVDFFHIFEMPILGYGGYLPFGLELFAMTNFVLPLLRRGTLTLNRPTSDTPGHTSRRAS